MGAGLRLVVDARVRKVQLDQLALFDEDESFAARSAQRRWSAASVTACPTTS